MANTAIDWCMCDVCMTECVYCRRCSKQKHGSPQRRVSRMHNYVSQEPNQTFQPVRFFSFGCKTTYAVHHYNQKVPTITHFLIFVGGGRCNATWWRKYASSWGLGAPTARSASKKQTEGEVSCGFSFHLSLGSWLKQTASQHPSSTQCKGECLTCASEILIDWDALACMVHT